MKFILFILLLACMGCSTTSMQLNNCRQLCKDGQVGSYKDENIDCICATTRELNELKGHNHETISN